MAQISVHEAMIAKVAEALGEDLLPQVAFVGGCTTGLLLSDDFSREQVRHTDDVDLIVHVVGYMGMHELEQTLRKRGFSHSLDEDDPICAMKLDELRVDFMPDAENAYGFTNRWYADALSTAQPFQLTETVTIRLVQPIYFLATKLEAYKGRGKSDPLESRDIEDLLALIDGREELMEEVKSASFALRTYLADEFSDLLRHPDFEYAVQGTALNDPAREALIFERLGKLVELAR
ncbi:Nucleotidyltransferase [Halomonas sp. NYA30]